MRIISPIRMRVRGRHGGLAGRHSRLAGGHSRLGGRQGSRTVATNRLTRVSRRRIRIMVGGWGIH